jgi:ActR/RegA family two-component response regulator
MTVTPSCPALLIHEDDAFRRELIAALDAKHFSVTFTANAAEGIKALKEKTFKVVLLSAAALEAVQYLTEHRRKGVILIAPNTPDIRKYAVVAEETLMKPVDAVYVADRARVYCRD